MPGQVTEKLREQLTHLDKEQALAEINALLTLADALQDKCEAREWKLWVTAGISAAWVFFSSILVTALGALLSLVEIKVGGATILAVCVSSAALLAVLTTLCVRAWKRQARDKQTIHGIVDMLREVEPAMADFLNFSALKQQQLKIRLRRFEIGPGVNRLGTS
jgi:hypothetical protein